MLTEVLAQLEDAKREGERERIGNAHLAVVSALGEMIEGAESAEQMRRLYRQMIEHTDEALKAYEGLGRPWRLSEAHLVKAAILADMAEDEEGDEGRLTHVGQSVYHCHQASTILDEADEFRYLILVDWHATAVAILLKLKTLVEGDGAQRALDGMIEAYSEILGASLAWDIRQRGEGNDLLFMARVLGTLAEVEEDSQERLEVVKSQLESAWGAAEYLRHTSDLGLAREAYALVEEASSQLSDLEAPIALQSQRPTCSICGHLNAPGKKFCTRCGAPLPAPELGDATLMTSGWWLTIANGPNAGQSFSLGDRVRLGRAVGNDIRLADSRVSRHHAVLERLGQEYLITDQGSSNGTYVNGMRIRQPILLHSGDTITIGDTQFTVLGEIPSPPIGTGETIICPACGARIAGRKFCTQCGTPLG